MAVTWLPFELHPEIPREGFPRERYFPPARLAQIEANLRQLAAEVGLTMKSRERMVNTRAALATAEFARERGVHGTVHHSLFQLHWEGPGEIDDWSELERIVAAAGLDPAELRAALGSGAYEGLLDSHRAEATGVGINAIPAHVFGRRYLVIGAQPEAIYRQVLGRLASA